MIDEIQKLPALLDEVHRLIASRNQRFILTNKIDEITFWRTNTGFEVDLVLGKKVAIEVKGTELISDKHLKGLRAFKEKNVVKRYVCVSLDSAPRKTEDGIEILPVQKFLKRLWAGEFL